MRGLRAQGLRFFRVLYNSGLVELFANWKTAWGSLLLVVGLGDWLWLNGWEIQKRKRLELENHRHWDTERPAVCLSCVYMSGSHLYMGSWVSRNPCSAWRTSHAPLSHRHTCLGGIWNQWLTGKTWPSQRLTSWYCTIDSIKCSVSKDPQVLCQILFINNQKPSTRYHPVSLYFLGNVSLLWFLWLKPPRSLFQ